MAGKLRQFLLAVQVQHLTDALEKASSTATDSKHRHQSLTSLVVELIDVQLNERRNSIKSLQQLLQSLPQGSDHGGQTRGVAEDSNTGHEEQSDPDGHASS